MAVGRASSFHCWPGLTEHLRNLLAVFRNPGRERRQLAGFQVGLQGFDDGLDRIAAALFQGAENSHQHRLQVGTVPAAVAVTVDTAINENRPRESKIT